jgi:hypothetical protein
VGYVLVTLSLLISIASFFTLEMCQSLFSAGIIEHVKCGTVSVCCNAEGIRQDCLVAGCFRFFSD